MTLADLTTSAQAPPIQAEAIALLSADHQHFSDLFAEYTTASTPADKKRIVADLCAGLSVHVQLEEEIFYPAFQKALNDKALVPEALVEHESLQNLIDQVQGLEPVGEMFDARIKVLSEFVTHHVKEEQCEMFPKAQGSSMDLYALGAQMLSRKAELLSKQC
jgi:iron-sulfur cluster repair protein YtfE (RIC family)